MTIDEAIRDLLERLHRHPARGRAGRAGDIVAAGPGAAAAELAAARRPALGGGGRQRRRLGGSRARPRGRAGRRRRRGRASRRTATRASSPSPGRDPAVGLLLFDLRTCLGDAFAEEEAQ